MAVASPLVSGADLAHPLDRAALRAVDRAMAELRRGDVVLLAGADGRALLVQAAEAATTAAIDFMAKLSGTAPALLVTARRAAALGIPAAGSPDDGLLVLTGTATVSAELARDLSDPTRLPPEAQAERARRVKASPVAWEGTAEGAAALLAKLARLLPSVLVAEVAVAGDRADFLRRHDLLAVEGADVAGYHRQSARTLHRIVEATVPLADAERTRIVAFRPTDGSPEHLAIIIGDPAPGEPVLARLHSECFTGDLLGSLRCDCGPQLRGAIQQIADAGSGVLLYLAQEGRGIGLLNKLRAYRLQDGGIDTVDANLALGFEADERVYAPAAAMLHGLGYGRVRLMTNNPDKMAQLAQHGIEVVDRVPHIFPSNGHNEAYLRAKASRSGHLF
ncbi:MAG TPA: GTP cyclohydrolase II [Azospirillaceae bacterium]|nr:GTP cyclohydrolase II [Azospirillaceae bacterium]